MVKERKQKTPVEPQEMPQKYPVELLESFYWSWEQSGRTITPDGRPWIDQDPTFWYELALFERYQKWAEWVVEHPEPVDRTPAQNFKDL